MIDTLIQNFFIILVWGILIGLMVIGIIFGILEYRHEQRLLKRLGKYDSEKI